MSGLTLITKGMIGCLNIPQRKRFEGGDGGVKLPKQPRIYYQDMSITESKKEPVIEMFVEMKLVEENDEDTTI